MKKKARKLLKEGKVEEENKKEETTPTKIWNEQVQRLEHNWNLIKNF